MCCTDLKEELGGSIECYSNSNVASENGKQFRIEKPNNVELCKVQIDGCLIQNQAVDKCDYLFKICQSNQIFLVELKGTDVIHAVNQITSTYDQIRNKIDEPPINYKGFIISSSVPRAAEQNFRKQQEKVLKQKGFLIKKGHQKHVEKIN
ncbi:hypothetical protein QWY31_02925 [Cytophagales bacterium LB-30]|uniref:Uncharacterized protein n=1 Tax=Shiella aurantiaca TaxID=3058365 RepID=A0ABT8F207_9BACT|nr:hypothetical protein [Shiella aurantiaca]MDN4164435.1 hypothetical protein [Shiella aurantiaca]